MTYMEPIVIIGAGPVGLITALRLSQFGMRSIIIEKNKAIHELLYFSQ